MATGYLTRQRSILYCCVSRIASSDGSSEVFGCVKTPVPPRGLSLFHLCPCHTISRASVSDVYEVLIGSFCCTSSRRKLGTFVDLLHNSETPPPPLNLRLESSLSR